MVLSFKVSLFMKTKRVCLSTVFRQQKSVSEDSISSPKLHSAPLMLVISFYVNVGFLIFLFFCSVIQSYQLQPLFKLTRHYLLMIATNIMFIQCSSYCHMHVVRYILWKSEGTTWACRLWHRVRINMFQFRQITQYCVSAIDPFLCLHGHHFMTLGSRHNGITQPLDAIMSFDIDSHLQQ